jgi:hypothetical protein
MTAVQNNEIPWLFFRVFALRDRLLPPLRMPANALTVH